MPTYITRDEAIERLIGEWTGDELIRWASEQLGELYADYDDSELEERIKQFADTPKIKPETSQ